MASTFSATNPFHPNFSAGAQSKFAIPHTEDLAQYHRTNPFRTLAPRSASSKLPTTSSECKSIAKQQIHLDQQQPPRIENRPSIFSGLESGASNPERALTVDSQQADDVSKGDSRKSPTHGSQLGVVPEWNAADSAYMDYNGYRLQPYDQMWTGDAHWYADDEASWNYYYYGWDGSYDHHWSAAEGATRNSQETYDGNGPSWNDMSVSWHRRNSQEPPRAGSVSSPDQNISASQNLKRRSSQDGSSRDADPSVSLSQPETKIHSGEYGYSISYLATKSIPTASTKREQTASQGNSAAGNGSVEHRDPYVGSPFLESYPKQQDVVYTHQRQDRARDADPVGDPVIALSDGALDGAHVISLPNHRESYAASSCSGVSIPLPDKCPADYTVEDSTPERTGNQSSIDHVRKVDIRSLTPERTGTYDNIDEECRRPNEEVYLDAGSYWEPTWAWPAHSYAPADAIKETQPSWEQTNRVEPPLYASWEPTEPCNHSADSQLDPSRGASAYSADSAWSQPQPARPDQWFPSQSSSRRAPVVGRYSNPQAMVNETDASQFSSRHAPVVRRHSNPQAVVTGTDVPAPQGKGRRNSQPGQADPGPVLQGKVRRNRQVDPVLHGKVLQGEVRRKSTPDINITPPPEEAVSSTPSSPSNGKWYHSAGTKAKQGAMWTGDKLKDGAAWVGGKLKTNKDPDHNIVVERGSSAGSNIVTQQGKVNPAPFRRDTRKLSERPYRTLAERSASPRDMVETPVVQAPEQARTQEVLPAPRLADIGISGSFLPIKGDITVSVLRAEFPELAGAMRPHPADVHVEILTCDSRKRFETDVIHQCEGYARWEMKQSMHVRFSDLPLLLKVHAKDRTRRPRVLGTTLLMPVPGHSQFELTSTANRDSPGRILLDMRYEVPFVLEDNPADLGSCDLTSPSPTHSSP